MRLAKIAATLDRWRVTEVAAADVLSAADHLWEFMASEFAGASWRSEVPLASRIDDQLIRGRIDLLIEGTDWFAILDHKSFPGNRALWEAKAVSYAPQLSLYARGVEVAIGKQCRGTWVHMPVAGVMLHVAPQVSYMDLSD